jgi:uncharacterized membrane protein YphA (DoxX/SURF4 family)/peroxiredoxin
VESAWLIGRILLAVVFATAGVAKLLDLEGSRKALTEFGVTERLAPAAAVALPLAELAIAVGLLPVASARWATLAAIVLLLGFVLGIANALRHDRAPDCHCFGQLHSAPAGGATLARNLVLALLAGLIVWQGPGQAFGSWMAAVAVVVPAGAIAVALSTRAARRQKREREKFLREHSGVPLGSPAPAFELAGVCNGGRSLDSLRAEGKPVVLMFTDPACCPCAELYPHVSRWQQSLKHELTIAVLSTGAAQANRPLCTRYGIEEVLLADNELFADYRIPGTPAAVIVAPDGSVAGGTASGREMIEQLIRLAVGRDRGGAERWEQPSLSG